jgi:hypothetical protein
VSNYHKIPYNGNVQFYLFSFDQPGGTTPLLDIALGVALLAAGLGGCGTINTYLADGASDYIPHWLGGMPADAPPRPGTAKYDEFMRDRDQKRLEPAPPKQDAAQSPASGLDAVH